MAGRRLSSNDVSVVIALAIVVLVLLLIFIVERGGGADDAGAAGAVDRRAELDATVATSFIGAPSNAPRAPSASGTCGIGELQREPGQSDEDVAARQRDEAVQAILAALDSRPEPRARAAALYFRSARDRIDALAADECRQGGPACAASEPRRGDRDRAALARLAVESADPQVYAWAYRSCAAAARDVAGSCQLVNALQWARLDPTNAEPWFAVAIEARRRRDAAAVDDAMFHVAAAAIHDPGWARAAAQMIAAAPQADGMAVGTWLASLDAIRYETLDLGMPEPWRYCEARAIANANRRDTCEKIATVLAERSTTLIGRTVGVGLAKKLDWAPARLAVMEQEGEAAHALELREASPPGQPLDCGNVRRDLSRWVDIARVGEVEALRRRVDSTGESITKLAAEGREAARLEHEATVAQAVASSASGAASAAAATASNLQTSPSAR